MEPIRRAIEGFLRGRYGYEERYRAFRVLAVAVVLVAVCVTSASLQQAPTYEASARVLVDWQQDQWWENSGGSGEELQTLEYRELPTPEIIRLIGSPGVAKEAIQRLGLHMRAAKLLNNLTAEQVEGTRFIRLTYEDTDPYKAKLVVNTVGEEFSKLAERRGTFTATVWEKAAVPTTPVSPHPFRNGLLTLVVGLVLCAGTVVALPGVAASAASTLGEEVVRQGYGRARAPAEPPADPNEAERSKEKELLQALGRRGKLTAVEAALETSLSVGEAERLLQELAFAGHLEVTVEHGRLLYSFWGEHGA